MNKIHWLKLSQTDFCNVDLNLTLTSGQAFRWKFDEFTHLGNDWRGIWTGVLFNHLILLKQSPAVKYSDAKCSAVFYSSLPYVDEKEHYKKIESDLVDYFQLNDKRVNQYFNNTDGWKDPHLRKAVSALSGLRVLRQEPIETLLGFICSSQNNIPRISQMVENLCQHYGTPIFNFSLAGRKFHTIPQLNNLTNDKVEKHLRELKFGYRAKFIVGSAKYIVENGGDSWLYQLRNEDYCTAQKALIQLPGVGLKVADCICIYSLDKTEAVPVDTHIFQIAQRYYAGTNQLPVIQSKTLSEKQYKTLGDCLRNIWCPHAGYAQTFMFSADLRKIDLSTDIAQIPMESFGTTAKPKKRKPNVQKKKPLEKSISKKKKHK